MLAQWQVGTPALGRMAPLIVEVCGSGARIATASSDLVPGASEGIGPTGRHPMLVHTRRYPRSAARAALALLVALFALVPMSSTASAAEGDPIPPAEAATGWLAAELAANDGSFPSPFGGGFRDWGLTIDAVLALIAGGHGDDAIAGEAVRAVSDNLAAYATGADFAPDDRYANALAKALLLERSSGTDLGGGFDVEAELRALEQLEGAEAGRFSDVGATDFSNGLGQALAVIALDDTTSGVPAAAVRFLLGQQCPAGGFRLYYRGYPLESDPVTFEPTVIVEDATCSTDDQIDPDATAMAIQALLAAPAVPEAPAALDRALAWLQAQQQASGAFVGTGAANTNTTGLAAQALRAAGRGDAADRAAAFVASLQSTSCADFGAIAYDEAALAAGVDADRAQWQRATAQGALALGLPGYAAMGETAPVGAGLALIACAAAPVPGTPGAAPTPAAAGDPGPTPAPRTLPATGAGSGAAAALGAALIGVGALCLSRSRRRAAALR